MKKVVSYQIGTIIVIFVCWSQAELGNLPIWMEGYSLPIRCILVAALAGNLYCLRAVYLNYSVKNRWSTEWEIWYYLRPITSALAGLVAFIFLKAGVVILEAAQTENAGHFGYFAFSFIAGYNVDRFLKKIEDLATSAFGVEKSRSYTKEDSDN